MKEKPKIVVIGLDGATWDVIHPLVHEGYLPTFRTLLEKGSHAKMRSSIPYTTFPAWKCYSTGKNPGKLGVFWFARVDFEAKKYVPHSSSDFESKELWDYLTDCGYVCGVINMPTTYPPKEIKGFMISGPPTPEEKDYTYPRELEKGIKEKYNYRVNPDPARFILQEKPDLVHIEELLDMRFKVTMDFVQKVDFLHTTLFYIDSVQHFYWHEKDAILRIYTKVDAFLDEIMKKIGEKSYLFLVSDHGFGQQSGIFYLNEWLAKEGYLVKKQNIRRVLPLVLPSRQNMMKAARSTRAVNVLPRIVPKYILNRLLNLFPRKGRCTMGTSVEDYIDWEKTVALAAYSLLYIDKRKLSKDEYKKLTDCLINDLKNALTTDNCKCIQKVFQCSHIYEGDYVDYGPDLAVQPENGYEINHAIFHKTPEIWRKIQKGSHRRTGIFLGYGPAIKKNGGTDFTMDIYDVAPTILHICGLPVPADMDGRVLKEIFEQDSELAKRKIVYQSTDEKEKIREKVEALRKTGNL